MRELTVLAARRAAATPAPPADAEECLIAAARAAPGAFTPLYQRYLDRIYRYCYSRLGTRESAEDATSEVFLKALAGLPRFQGGIFAAWLYTIARNVVNDQFRKRSKEPSETIPDDSPADEATEHSPEERMVMRSALARLSDEQRTILELQVAGWSGAEVAAIVGKSPAATRMIRYRAVERLKELLAMDTEPKGGR